MKTNAALISYGEEDRKKELKAAIKRKRKQLLSLQEKISLLEEELGVIEEEYTRRIGTLYQEDMLLDLAILRRRRINQLISEGKTSEEAEQTVQERMEKETEQVERKRIDSFFAFFEADDSLKLDEQQSIRTLWKKLVRQFHPDLTSNHAEKVEREKLLKTINTAYRENDLATLQTIEENGMLNRTHETDHASILELEELLIGIENGLIRMRDVYKMLRKSEWYSFWKVAKKTRDKLFADMEQRLKNDITNKQALLTSLMSQKTQK